jgi:DNA-binding transcriptional ArsR family regulator
MKTTHREDRERVPFELIARRLKAMADPARLVVLRRLCDDGERCVTELVRVTGLTQSNLSKHLRILKDEGLVVSRREHRRVFYRVSSRVPDEICSLMCRSLKARAAAEGSVLGRYLGRAR